MNAKEYLTQIKKLNVLIENKLTEVERLRDRAESVTACVGGEKVKSTSRSDNMENTIIKLIDMSRAIEKEVDKLVELKTEATHVIDMLDKADEINLLYKRYIQFKTWEQIAEEMDYSLQGIYKMHGFALQKVQKILNCIVK